MRHPLRISCPPFSHDLSSVVFLPDTDFRSTRNVEIRYSPPTVSPFIFRISASTDRRAFSPTF